MANDVFLFVNASHHLEETENIDFSECSCKLQWRVDWYRPLVIGLGRGMLCGATMALTAACLTNKLWKLWGIVVHSYYFTYHWKELRITIINTSGTSRTWHFLDRNLKLHPHNDNSFNHQLGGNEHQAQVSPPTISQPILASANQPLSSIIQRSKIALKVEHRCRSWWSNDEYIIKKPKHYYCPWSTVMSQH